MTSPSSSRRRARGRVVEQGIAYAILMNPIAEGIARTVLRNFPHTLCFSCLAVKQGIQEHDVRAAALVLIARAHFDVVTRVCDSCLRSDESLVFRDGR